MKIGLQDVIVLMALSTFLGCAIQVDYQGSAQADVEKPQEEPAKAGMPTFTYRPGGKPRVCGVMNRGHICQIGPAQVATRRDNDKVFSCPANQ
jgi:hypothetical protein